MLGIPAALLYTNVGEWVIHRYVLHGLGKRKQSFWAFHWHEHHGNVRRNEHLDPAYERSLLGWNAQSKEAWALVAAGLLHAPLLPVAPFFTATLWASLLNYYRVHKRSHCEPEWAREHLPWHYDHHMGPDQDQNWCVSWPWADWLFGTRQHYVGTAREAQDQERARAFAARRAAQLARLAAAA